MSITSATARTERGSDHRSVPAVRSSRQSIVHVAWFSGLSIAAAIVAIAAGATPALVPFLLALVPTMIALAIAWREGGGAFGRLRSSLTRRPTHARWYLVLGIPLVWSSSTVVIAVALGEPTAGLFDSLFPAALIIPLVVLVPAFAEELAWRGFALPRLMSVMSPLAAAVVLAIPWTVIHLFLFLPGQWYEGLALWPLVVSILAYSVILSWVFVKAGGSVLMTTLVHAGFNGTAPIMAGIDGDASWVIRALVAGGIALGIIAIGGLRDAASPPR